MGGVSYILITSHIKLCLQISAQQVDCQCTAVGHGRWHTAQHNIAHACYMTRSQHWQLNHQLLLQGSKNMHSEISIGQGSIIISAGKTFSEHAQSRLHAHQLSLLDSNIGRCLPQHQINRGLLQQLVYTKGSHVLCQDLKVLLQ